MSLFSTILFDLDGTLLPMDMDVFMEAYFQAVTRKFAHLFDPKKLVREILAGTEKMFQDVDPQKTNHDVFWSYFIPRIGFPYEEIYPLFDEFYSRDFTNLKSAAQPNPLARPLLELLFQRGYRVAIATNPVFPEKAIRERLNWVEIGDFPFALVTSYENSHFCKPKIEYYEEIISTLDVNPGECLMIGNDVDEDLCARELGIKTFLVEDWLLNKRDLPVVTDYRGSFRDLVSLARQLTAANPPASSSGGISGAKLLDKFN